MRFGLKAVIDGHRVTPISVLDMLCDLALTEGECSPMPARTQDLRARTFELGCLVVSTGLGDGVGASDSKGHRRGQLAVKDGRRDSIAVSDKRVAIRVCAPSTFASLLCDHLSHSCQRPAPAGLSVVLPTLGEARVYEFACHTRHGLGFVDIGLNNLQTRVAGLALLMQILEYEQPSAEDAAGHRDDKPQNEEHSGAGVQVGRQINRDNDRPWRVRASRERNTERNGKVSQPTRFIGLTNWRDPEGAARPRLHVQCCR